MNWLLGVWFGLRGRNSSTCRASSPPHRLIFAGVGFVQSSDFEVGLMADSVLTNEAALEAAVFCASFFVVSDHVMYVFF